MKRSRSVLSLMLAVLLTAAAALPALAVTFTAGQYYEHDASATRVYSVQVSISSDRSAMEQRRDKMLELGYDAFVYKYEGRYKAMCGKFRTQEAALDYCEDIHHNTDRGSAYVTNAYLPESAVKDFENKYKGNEVPEPPSGGYGWEDPSGLYYNADAYTGPTTTYYTVQFSAGTSFDGAERSRDAMIAQGFDSFVYKIDKKYRIMSGIFTNKSDAEALCERIKTETDRTSAYVTTIALSSPSPNLPTPSNNTGDYPAPTLAGATDTTYGVLISWKTVKGVTNYAVFRKSGNGSWARIGTTTSDCFLDTTTDSGTRYTYTVRCLSGDGKSYISSYDPAGVSIG